MWQDWRLLTKELRHWNTCSFQHKRKGHPIQKCNAFVAQATLIAFDWIKLHRPCNSQGFRVNWINLTSNAKNLELNSNLWLNWIEFTWNSEELEFNWILLRKKTTNSIMKSNHYGFLKSRRLLRSCHQTKVYILNFVRLSRRSSHKTHFCPTRQAQHPRCKS